MIPRGWGLERGLDLIKKSGFDGVELWLGGSPWLQVATTDADVIDLARRVKNAGLAVSNVSNTLDWDHPISSRDRAIRQQAFRHIERQIEVAHLVGTDAILVVAGLVTDEVPYNEVYTRTVEAVKTLATKRSEERRVGKACRERR